MSINYRAWQDGIRAAWTAKTLINPANMGPWGNSQEIYRLPFGPGRIFVVSWAHFYKPGKLKLNLDETFNDSKTESINYVDPGLTDSTGTRTVASTVSVERTIPRQWVFLSTTPEEFEEEGLPEIYAHRVHSSACPFGEGLYDAEGAIRIVAPTRFVNTYTGVPFIPDSDTTTDQVYMFHYRSDCDNINGLNTPARVTISQYLHGPANAFRQNVQLDYDLPGSPDNDYTLTDIPFDPQELDPDGVPGSDVEQYVEETALRALSQGLMSMEMVRLGGTASRSNGPYDDGAFSAESSWSHSWSRTGLLELTISP